MGRLRLSPLVSYPSVLTKVFEEDLSNGSLESRSVAMTIHLEADTAYLASLLSQARAE